MVAFPVARIPLWRRLPKRLRIVAVLLALTALALSLPAGLEIRRQRNKPAEVVALERPLTNFLGKACPGSQVQVLATHPLHILATVEASPERCSELEGLLQELCTLDAGRGDRLILIPGTAPAGPPFVFIFLVGFFPALLILQQVASWLSSRKPAPGPEPTRRPRSRRKIFSCPVCDEVFIDEESLRQHEKAAHSKNRCYLAVGLILLAALAFLPRPALERIVLPDAQSNRQAAEPLVEIARLADLDRLLVVEGQQFTVVAAPKSDLSQLQRLAESVGLEPSRVRITHLPEPAPRWWGGILLGPGLGLLLWKPRPRPAQVVAVSPPAPAPSSVEPPALETLDSLMRVEPLEIHLGRRLLALVDDCQGAQLKHRVASIQRHIGHELGLTMPGVKFRDNLALASQDYTILVSDCVAARGTIHVNHFLAIGPLEKLKSLSGEVILDPTYQLPGKWISPHRRGDAERLGCMLFDPVSVLATQLTEVVRFRAAQLLGVAEVSLRLQEDEYRSLAGTLAAKGVDSIVVWKVLRLLLKERVSIRDLVSILQAIAEYVHLTREPVYLAEFARVALSSAICKEHVNERNFLNVVTLDSNLEGLFNTGFPDPPTGFRVLEALGEQILNVQEMGLSVIFLTSPAARFRIRQLLERTHPEVRVLSWNEIARDIKVNSIAHVQIT